MMTKRTVPLILHPAVMLVTPVGVLFALSFMKDEVGLPLMAFACGAPIGVAISLPILRLWLGQLSSLDPAKCRRWDLSGRFIPEWLQWVVSGVVFLSLVAIGGVGQLLALPTEAITGAWVGFLSGWLLVWWAAHLMWWCRLPPG